MGYKRVITKMTEITACLCIDGNDPVEIENLKGQERGGEIARANVLG